MRLFTGVIAILFLGLTLLPVGAMVWQTFASGTIASHFDELFLSAQAWKLLRHTILLATLVTLLTTLVGVPLGILMGKTDLPLRPLFVFLFLVPLLLPPYIVAVAWNDLSMMAGFGSGTLSGLGGSLFVLFCIYLSVPTLMTILFLRTVPPSLEEAGRLCAPWPSVLRYVTLPMILPGILLSAMIVFLLSLGELSVPIYLHYEVYAVESFTQFTAFYRFDTATATALPLILVALVMTMAENRFLKKRTATFRHFAGSDTFLRISLGFKRYPLFLAAAFLAGVVTILPMTALALKAGDFHHLAEAFLASHDALLRSLLYAAAGATLLTFFGFLLGYTLLKRPFRCAGALDPVAIFLFTLPGTVVAIAMIFFWNRPFAQIVYATPLIVLLGYLAKYSALTERISLARLSMIPASMEEAAQMAGADWSQRLRHILLPLAADAIAGAWVVAYLFILRDVDLTILLYPPGEDTLPVRIFTMMANGSPELVASLCLIMATVTLLPAAAAWGVFVRKRRRK